jgi:deoxyribose-phosphate aldolase
MSLTNPEWTREIKAKIAAIEADNSTPSYLTRTPSKSEIAKFIDHTLLKPDSNEDQIDELCKEAKEYGFKVYTSNF